MTSPTLQTTRLILTAFVAGLLAGCGTIPASKSSTPGVPATAAAPAVEAKPAHITGSEEASALLDNFTAFITAIDGQPVAGGRAGWKTPLALRPGSRRLSVEFNRGVFRARSEIALLVVGEANYQLRFDCDAQFLGKNSYCEFWIADTATGQAITPRIRADLTRIEPAK